MKKLYNQVRANVRHFFFSQWPNIYTVSLKSHLWQKNSVSDLNFSNERKYISFLLSSYCSSSLYIYFNLCEFFFSFCHPYISAFRELYIRTQLIKPSLSKLYTYPSRKAFIFSYEQIVLIFSQLKFKIKIWRRENQDSE